MGDFLGMGWLEIMAIAVVAIIVLGPERLPQYARKAGRFIRQFRKITSGITQEISKSLELDDIDEVGDGIKKDLREISRSLEDDAASLRKSFSDEALAMEKTVNEGVGEVRESLARESAEITEAIKESAEITEKGLSEGLAEARENLGTGHTSPEAMVDYRPPPLPEGDQVYKSEVWD